MKKQMLKKVYAMVLAITLIGSQQCSSVLANDIAQIYSGVTQNTEIPDYDYWMAQTIMNGIDNKFLVLNISKFFRTGISTIRGIFTG